MKVPMITSNAGQSHALVGYGGAVAGLHLTGWGLCLICSGARPALLGLGLSAYLCGSRHAFDADHIAAVDDSVRLLLVRERRSLGAGFFLALGHSSVAFVLALCSAFAAALLARHLHGLQTLGAMQGNLVSLRCMPVTFALGIGSIELMRALIPALELHDGMADLCRRLSIGGLGYLVVGSFVMACTLSQGRWRLGGWMDLTRRRFGGAGSHENGSKRRPSRRMSTQKNRNAAAVAH